MSFLSPIHIVFFAAIALLALGPKRFPDFTKALGNTMREFREVMSGMPGRDSLSVAAPDPDAAAAPAPAPAPVAAPEGPPAPAGVTGAPASAAVRSPGLDAQPPAA